MNLKVVLALIIDEGETNISLILAGLIGFAGVGALLYKLSKKQEPIPQSAVEEDKDDLQIEKAAKRPNATKIDNEEGELLAAGESLGEDPKLQHNVEELVLAAAHSKEAPTTKSIFAAILEKAFMDSIRKVVKSSQTENVQEYMKMKDDGKTSWTKTHFIFALDCSGSMLGNRWTAVTIGFGTFLKRVKSMENILISAFTFDIKVNPFCKERTIEEAIKNSVELPFTGKGTNYKRALEYGTDLIERSTHKDYLICIMFLSDGLGSYPEQSIEKLKQMREDGRKIIFYTIACETNEEADMIKMTTELDGEHYKVMDADAARLVFSAILKV